MKNKLFVVVALIFTCTFTLQIYAQPAVDPTIFVSPFGANTGDGTGFDFNDAISPNQLMANILDVNNPVYAGDVTIYFAGGDYYTDFIFQSLPNTITSLSLYGGFDDGNYDSHLNLRDLINHETIFHATGNDITLKIEPSNQGVTSNCIINGITLTSDNSVNYLALSIVGVECLVSQCRIENFSTNFQELIWLEDGSNTITFVSCVFSENDAANLMSLYSNVNLINVTIADNYFSHDMFVPHNSILFQYTMQNSIIYNNSNMDMDYSVNYFYVYNSLLENQEYWINDIGGNIYNTDPLFIYNPVAMYACDYFCSPTINAGDPAFITLASFYNLSTYDILEYDVVNVYRFGSSQQTSIDIGAYQSGDDSYSYYNNIGHPLMRKNCHNYSNEKKPIWSQSQKVFVDNKQKTQVGLILYNMSGQMVYETSLNEGLNTISTSLSAGTYIVRTISAGGDNNYTKILITK